MVMRWDMHRQPSDKQAPTHSTAELEARTASIRLPLARLLQLLMILQSERFPNASRLAEACAVSRRTIYRDLGILDAAGISVLYHPDRQGYELVRGCLLQPIQLEEKEALALLIVSRLGCSDDPFGILRHARNGLAKVVQALPGELRDRISRSGELIVEETTDLLLPPDRLPIYETILGALSRRLRLRLWYLAEDSSQVLTTKLSLYRLTRIRGQWSLVGHSSSHREVRLFPVPYIQRLELTEEPYTIPPRFRLERFLGKSSNSQQCPPRQDVQLRFSSRVAPAVRDTLRQREQKLSSGPRGELELSISVEVLDEIVVWVLGFGDQVEVLKPEALRSAVRDWAEQIARIHTRNAIQDLTSQTERLPEHAPFSIDRALGKPPQKLSFSEES
jgi:predicted DNA-binding transcriptional regulator YafY